MVGPLGAAGWGERFLGGRAARSGRTACVSHAVPTATSERARKSEDLVDFTSQWLTELHVRSFDQLVAGGSR